MKPISVGQCSILTIVIFFTVEPVCSEIYKEIKQL